MPLPVCFGPRLSTVFFHGAPSEPATAAIGFYSVCTEYACGSVAIASESIGLLAANPAGGSQRVGGVENSHASAITPLVPAANSITGFADDFAISSWQTFGRVVGVHESYFLYTVAGSTLRSAANSSTAPAGLVRMRR